MMNINSAVCAKITQGLYVIGTKDREKTSGFILDALMMATVDPMIITIGVMKTGFTHEMLKKVRKFAVSVLHHDVDPFVIANFGFQSSRTVDKWSHVDHDLFNDMPVLRDTAASLYCEVIDYRDLPTHTVFFCAIKDSKIGMADAMSYEHYQKNMKQRTMDAFKAFCGGVSCPVPEAAKSDTSGGDGVSVKKEKNQEKENKKMDDNGKWVCSVCGYEYDGEIPFEQLPEDYACPLCMQPKSVFEKIV